MMNPNETVQLTIRAAQQAANKEGGVGLQGPARRVQRAPEGDRPGHLEACRHDGGYHTLELLTYKVEVDDQVIFDIDKLGGKYVVNGEDLRAEINALI